MLNETKKPLHELTPPHMKKTAEKKPEQNKPAAAQAPSQNQAAGK